MARIGLVDFELGLDAGRPVTENDDAPGEQQRLLDVVRHQQRGKAASAPELDQLFLQRQAGQRSRVCRAARRAAAARGR